MPGEGIVPPQGFGDGGQKVKYFYGLPMSMPTGGAGTKIGITVRMPLNPGESAGSIVRISGDLEPFTPPPVIHSLTEKPKNTAGTRAIASVVPQIGTPWSGGGTRAYIIPIPPIVVISGAGSNAINQGL